MTAQPRPTPQGWQVAASVSAVALLVGAVVLTAVNRTTDSDMMGSLLASESLVSGHWLSLDHYPDLVKTALGYRAEVLNGHLYYSFPIGTSLLVAPVIGILNSVGIDVVPNDDKIQIGLAAVAAIATFLLSYLLARRFQRHWVALILAGVFWFGSALASSGATALWSHNFGVVLSLGALLALVSALQKHQRRYAAVRPSGTNCSCRDGERRSRAQRAVRSGSPTQAIDRPRNAYTTGRDSVRAH